MMASRSQAQAQQIEVPALGQLGLIDFIWQVPSRLAARFQPMRRALRSGLEVPGDLQMAVHVGDGR